MRVAILGANGQLGQELIRNAPAGVEISAFAREQLDICDAEALRGALKEAAPDVIVNSAAYTAVDGAETKPDLAVAVNGEGPGNVAQVAETLGARMLHLSTDFVFDGQSDTPYLPSHEPRPLGVYGHSKLAGECRVRELLPCDSVILRTAWVYSPFGNNFVKTMLHLMNERDELRVVGDQVGSPTQAAGLAQVVWAFLEQPELHGTYHWTDAGQCSWFQFAAEILEQGRRLGLIEGNTQLEEIPTSDYPTPARRPAYSVLDCSSTRERLGLEQRPWQDQLSLTLQELARR